MATQGTPRVIGQELDLAITVSESLGVPCLINGRYNKGRLDERILVTSQDNGNIKLGTPTTTNADPAYYVLYPVLEETDTVWAARVYNQDNPPTYGGMDVGTAIQVYADILTSTPGPSHLPSAQWTVSMGRRLAPHTITIWDDANNKIAYDVPNSTPQDYKGLMTGDSLDGTTPTDLEVDYLLGTVKFKFLTAAVPHANKKFYIRATGIQPYSWDVGKASPETSNFHGPLNYQRIKMTAASSPDYTFSDTLALTDIIDITDVEASFGSPVPVLAQGGAGNAFQLTYANGLEPGSFLEGAYFSSINQPEQYLDDSDNVGIGVGEGVTDTLSTVALWYHIGADDTWVYLGHVGSAGTFVNSITGAVTGFSINYATGAIGFTLHDTVVPLDTNIPDDVGDNTGNYAVISYFSNESVLFEAYGDNQGSWVEDYSSYITQIKPNLNDFSIVMVKPTNTGTLPIFANYEVSRDLKKNEFGIQMYLENQINDNSDYLRVKDNVQVAVRGLSDEVKYLPSSSLPYLETDPVPTLTVMGGGEDGDSPSGADYIRSYDFFNNPEEVDIRLVPETFDGDVSVPQTIIDFCDFNFGGRGDSFGILSIPLERELRSDPIQAAIDYRRYDLGTSTSFASLNFGYVEIEDQYTGRLVLASPTGYRTQRLAFTLRNNNAWTIGAGWRRGRINVRRILTKLDKGQSGLLYDNDINYWRQHPTKGRAAWGDKTLYGLNSPLSRIMSRTNLIEMEKAIDDYLDDQIFENNTSSTRALVSTDLDGYLGRRLIKGAFYAYRVQCDNGNNSSADIANHLLNVDVFVELVAGIEYIIRRTVIAKVGSL